jgi:hypothetical protein
MTNESARANDSQLLEDYKMKIKSSGKPYLLVEDEATSDEYAHFYFVGNYEGEEVVYDAVLITLRLQHESELFELAEHEAAKHFPEYKKISYQEDENGNMEALDDLEEEIGLFMAEVIMELEEEEQVKVKEHVDIDANMDFEIGIDAALHVERITDQVIQKFIKDFNENTLQLDDSLYTFQTEDQTA